MRCPTLMLAALVFAAPGPRASAQSQPLVPSMRVPVAHYRLGNGLRVVLSPDSASPVVHVGMYFRVGSRHEPRGRAGFAHLFEHLMFEGSPHLGSGDYFNLVVGSGGRFGARTLYDLTKYNALVPSHALERLLWAEADRLRGVRVSAARFEAVKAVVKNEVRQQAHERPYGRFVWIDLPEVAHRNWANAHSIYGDTPDGSMRALDEATLADAESFFRAYYRPGNAVLVVAGGFDPADVRRWIATHFAPIPAGAAPAPVDVSEPRQAEERRHTVTDRNAPRPAVAVAYRMPERGTDDFWAMQVISQLLLEGTDGRLPRRLVRDRGLVAGVYGGVSAQHGSIYTAAGPTFWTTFAFHDSTTSADDVVREVEHELHRLRTAPVDSATLRRAVAKAQADFLAEVLAERGNGLADMLGLFTLFDGDPGRVNTMLARYDRTTPDRVLAAARRYLRPSQRTVVRLVPGARP